MGRRDETGAPSPADGARRPLGDRSRARLADRVLLRVLGEGRVDALHAVREAPVLVPSGKGGKRDVEWALPDDERSEAFHRRQLAHEVASGGTSPYPTRGSMLGLAVDVAACTVAEVRALTRAFGIVAPLHDLAVKRATFGLGAPDRTLLVRVVRGADAVRWHLVSPDGERSEHDDLDAALARLRSDVDAVLRASVGEVVRLRDGTVTLVLDAGDGRAHRLVRADDGLAALVPPWGMAGPVLMGGVWRCRFGPEGAEDSPLGTVEEAEPLPEGMVRVSDGGWTPTEGTSTRVVPVTDVACILGVVGPFGLPQGWESRLGLPVGPWPGSFPRDGIDALLAAARAPTRTGP